MDTTSEQMARDLQAPREPMRMTHLLRPFNRLIGTIPKSALSVPSMMSVAERRFLYGLASKYYRGEGVIVDAGIFLGASTRAFGEGLRDNHDVKTTRWPRPIISFERGIVTPTMPAFFKRNSLDIDLKPGDSFAEVVRSNVEPVVDIVDLRVGDIQQTGKVDQPIEILFLDVLKLPEINKFCVENYYPRLIPGRSIVLQQDYFYDLLPYIKTYQEYFAEYFAYVGEIGSTAVFLCHKEIPESVAKQIDDSLDAAEQIRLAGIALQRSNDPARRFLMALSKARLIRRLQGAKAAQEYLQFVKGEYPDVDVDGSPRLREALRSTEVVCRAKGAAPPPTEDLAL
jgi:predicted O-methyltransferase YrrM